MIHDQTLQHDKFLSEIDIIFKLITQYFDGDTQKAALWFKTKNPLLGGISPKHMIRYGRFKKLKEIIQNQIEGNIP